MEVIVKIGKTNKMTKADKEEKVENKRIHVKFSN